MFLLAVQNPGNWPTSTLALLGRFFSVIAALAFVMVLAYFVTRWLAGARYTRRGKSNIKLIEGIAVGSQATVQLVQAGEKAVLIGVTRERVTYLTEIPMEQVADSTVDLPRVPFEKYLSAYWKKHTNEPDEQDEP